MIHQSFDVDVYDIDLFDTPAETVQQLKNAGRIVVCYFSAGSFEGWREDWRQFFPDISGETYDKDVPPFGNKMSGWDERWLDIRRIDLLRAHYESSDELGEGKGCDAVEPDNMDAYTNGGETGLSLTAQDQLVYNRWVANEAHAIGLSVGLKNDVGQLAELVDSFDWALNEQCFQYSECGGYSVFVNQDKAVFGVEYVGDPRIFCPQAKALGLSWLKKQLSLLAWRQGCEDY